VSVLRQSEAYGGVWMNSQYFQGNRRVLSHEMGHVMGSYSSSSQKLTFVRSMAHFSWIYRSNELWVSE
jgi:hypothetical protein